jgi:hypothetical protein
MKTILEDEYKNLINRWNTVEGQAYYKAILKEYFKHQPLMQLASKYFGFIDEAIDLRGIDFHGRDLSHAVLAYCDISYGNFNSIVASEANFDSSDIFDVSFERAELKKCSFVGAHLKNTTFEKSSISRTSFNNSKLYRCNFSSANITKGDMAHCNFEGANLKKIEFDEVSLNSSKIPKSQECWIKANEGKYNDNLKRIEWI